MKKFKFTLEKFHAIKINYQDSLKQMIESVDKKIRDVEAALSALERAIAAERQKCADDCQRGTTTSKLREYDAYFKHAEDQRKLQQDRLDQLEGEANELRARIVVVNNEIKVLEKKRAEQYEAFLKELATYEAKALDDFISYKISSQ